MSAGPLALGDGELVAQHDGELVAQHEDGIGFRHPQDEHEVEHPNRHKLAMLPVTRPAPQENSRSSAYGPF
jgi:hypothetical protein